MKNDNLIHVCGSIVKDESLVSLTSNILPNTVVAEGNMPYAGYYGNVPQKANPNSIFLFTKFFFTLEEVLRFSQKIDLCKMNDVNVATSVLHFHSQLFPAIRVKHFPDYQKIEKLQHCMLEQNILLASKLPVPEKAVIKTTKCFELEKVGEDIYMDCNEEKTGYIALSKLIENETFEWVISHIRNNTACTLFDAARGAIIINSGVKDIVRFYSDNMDIELLKCAKEKFEKNF